MKIPIALLGLAAVGSLCCTPAFAGHWEVTYECDGSDVVKRENSPPQVTETEWPTNISSAVSRYAEIGPPAYIGNKVHLSGTVQAVFTWTQDSPIDTSVPPALLRIKETSKSVARCYYRWHEEDDTEGEEWITGTLANGFDDPVDTLRNWKSGVHLKTFEVPLNGVLRLPIRDLNAFSEMPNIALTLSPGATDGAQDSANITCELYYKAEVDTRVVQLTRAGAPTPKQGSDPTLIETKEEWVESDGTGHGHTLASYHEYGVLPPGTLEDHVFLDPREVYNTVSVVRSGNWSPTENVAYKWNPQKPTVSTPPAEVAAQEAQEGVIEAEAKSYQIRSMPFSNANNNPDGIGYIPDLERIVTKPEYSGWDNHPSNKKGSVVNYQYELTDLDDNAKSTAKYFLTLHDEWENVIPDLSKKWTDDNNVEHKGQTFTVHREALDVPRYVGPQTDISWTFSHITESLTTELKANFESSFKVKDWLNAAGSFETTAKLEIKAEMINNSSKLTINDTKDAIPCVRYTVLTDHKLVDHFTVNGWDRNTARTDGKFPQSADRPVAISDIGPSWIIVPTGQPIVSD